MMIFADQGSGVNSHPRALGPVKSVRKATLFREAGVARESAQTVLP